MFVKEKTGRQRGIHRKEQAQGGERRGEERMEERRGKRRGKEKEKRGWRGEERRREERRVPVVGLVEGTLCDPNTFLNCFFNVQPDSAAKLLCLPLLLLFVGDRRLALVFVLVFVLDFIVKLSFLFQLSV